MLRKRIVMLLFLLAIVSIPVFSFAGKVIIGDGFVTIPVGGGIVFPGGSILSNASGITGPMGPMGPQGLQGPAASGSIIANADVVYCYGVSECYCGAGKVVKAALSVKCVGSDVLNGSYLIDLNATGWGADCQRLRLETGTTTFNYGTPSSFSITYATGYKYDWVAPDHIVIACTTP